MNALLATPAGTMFVTALDTSGNTKDAKFIADFIIKIIEDKGPANIVAVCMDGACTASFPLITTRERSFTVCYGRWLRPRGANLPVFSSWLSGL